MSDNNSQNPMQQMFQMYMQGQFNNNNMPQNHGTGVNSQQSFSNQQQQMGNQQMNMGFNPMFSGNNMFFPPFPFIPQNTNINPGQQTNQNSENWNLIFKRKQDGQSLTIQIANNKTLDEAVNHYRIKSGDMSSNKFTSNNKPLNLGLILNQSGLANNSQIDAEQDSSGLSKIINLEILPKEIK